MENLFSNITVLGLLGALAGGFFGAAFGALVVFTFTGFALFIGISIILAHGDVAFLNQVALGPLGPHISFAAGVAAAAYAYKKGLLESGRDIVTALISLKSPSVLIVGAIFGVIGYVMQAILIQTPIGSKTDSVALTVVASAIIARFAFGKSGLMGVHHSGKTGMQRFEVCEQHSWIVYQDGWCMTSLTGLFIGGLSAWASVVLLIAYPQASNVILLGFAISAVSLTFLGMGIAVPVTHHITLVSAVAVSLFMDTVVDPTALVIIGSLAGLVVAIIGQVLSRFWLIRGDSHIDPPAGSIFIMTTILILISIAV